jgi:hypothetical protein
MPQNCLEQDDAAENTGRRFEASQSKELQITTYPEKNVEKRGELNVRHDDEKEVENSTGIGIKNERDRSSQKMKQINTQQESEKKHPMHWRQYPSRGAENDSFLLPQIQLLSKLAPELSKTPSSQRNVVSTQCDGSDEKQLRQVTLVAQSEKRHDRYVLSTANRFELRPSKTLGCLVAKIRESMGMMNDPLRLSGGTWPMRPDSVTAVAAAEEFLGWTGDGGDREILEINFIYPLTAAAKTRDKKRGTSMFRDQMGKQIPRTERPKLLLQRLTRYLHSLPQIYSAVERPGWNKIILSPKPRRDSGREQS